MSRKSSRNADNESQSICRYVNKINCTPGHENECTCQEYNGALSFATDAWTSPNHKAYIAITVHFQKDGVLVAMLLDLVEVAESHSGSHLAAAFVKVLEDFMITDKVSIQLYCFCQSALTVAQIISVTCDNASNNDTMVEALKDLLVVFPGESNRTRCFDHIINLIAKSIIRQFDVSKATGKSPDEALPRVLQELTAAEHNEGDDSDDDNADGWVDERAEMTELEQKDLDDDVQPVQQVLVKASLTATLYDVVSVLTQTMARPPSSARLRTPSKTPQPSSCPAGMLSLMNLS
jgi:hypothetical protein